MRVLSTTNEDLHLRELTPSEAGAYFTLVQRNATHLTRLGDYTEEVAATLEEQAAALATPHRFGIYLQDTLVGRADLIPVDPPRYGLGYWLAEEATGKGLATKAVEALLTYATTELRATDAFAGVTHGNTSSVALLARLGFTQVADFDRYTRFHKHL